MAAFRTGDPLVWIIGPVQDDSGAAVTGASFSAVSALKPDGTSFSPTYTEIGSGVYKATFVSTARGLWFLYSQATVNGVIYADTGSIAVDDELAYTASGAAGSVGAALAGITGLLSQTDDGVYYQTGNTGPIYVVPVTKIYVDTISGDRYLYEVGAVLSLPQARRLAMPGADI